MFYSFVLKIDLSFKYISFNLHPVFKCKTDVLLSIHCGVIHKAVPVVFAECHERAVQFFQPETNLPVRSRFACRSVMARLTSESRSFALLKRSAKPLYFFWYSVWSRAVRAFSVTHCPINSAATFISSCRLCLFVSSSAVPKNVSFMAS